jgi:multimeric flavodoxin WrbA
VVHAIAINGSPAMAQGNTAKVLTPFLDGMSAAGATVEHFYTHRLDLQPCTGELYCWRTTPGHCYINDDMQTLYPKLHAAHILVLATPVYIPLPSAMQTFLNRLCPLLDPQLEFRNGRTRARLHDTVNIRQFVLVATCGWWELGNFGTVVRIVDELAKDASVEFAGAVLRPHAGYMASKPKQAKQVTDALREAGHALVKTGELPPRLLDVIRQPLISEAEYRNRFNETTAQGEAGKKG